MTLPIAPVNSALWNITYEVHDDFNEQIGWHDLAKQVGDVYRALPPEDQARTGILAGNYGEAGALELYGSEFGLPQIISPVDSFWLKDAPSDNIDVLIVMSYSYSDALQIFDSCEIAGAITNSYGVINEEVEIGSFFLCKGLQQPWAEMWLDMRRFQ